MATWTVQTTSTGSLVLTYRNRTTGRVHSCGKLRAGTPPNLIIDWVLKSGDAGPGDLILLANGCQLQILPASLASA